MNEVTLSELDQQELRAGVEAGVKLLDEKWEGVTPWREKIDIETLNLVRPRSCVLGQLYGHYDFGREALDIEHFGDHGFNINDRIYQDLGQKRGIAHTAYSDRLTEFHTELWKEQLTVAA